MNMTWDSGGAIILSSVLAVIMVWVGNLVSKHWGNTESDTNEAHEKIEELLNAVGNLRSDFQKYQTHVAENYAKIPAIERMESNIFAAIARIEHKIDKLQER